MKAASIVRISIAVCAAPIMVACTSLTDIDAPGVVQPPSVDNAVGAAARFAGASRLFTTALVAQSGSIVAVGLLTDELISGNLPGNLGFIEIDQRRLPESYTQGGGYSALQTARVNLASASQALQQFLPTPPSRIGQALAYTGYVELVLGETFCAGVPFSSIVNGVETLGQPTTNAEVFARALLHFDSAAVFAVDSARVLNLIRLGKGRTLLGLGRYAEAAVAVAAVPTSYVYNLDISSTVTTQTNAIFSYMSGGGGGGVGDRDGGNGLNFRTAGDPRVPSAFAIRGLDNVTDIYRFTTYNSTAANVPLARGTEARLIEAEAALQANNNDAATTGTGWLGLLNTLRATAITPALPALADPGSYDARVDLLFRERAFWTYLTGQRLGSLRRLVRQYNRPANTVFPTGTYKDGLPFGADMTLPMGSNDGQNPFFKGCTNRDA